MNLTKEELDRVEAALASFTASCPSVSALTLCAMAKEGLKWKAAHDEMVKRNRILRDRHDLPTERIAAYDFIMRDRDNLIRTIDELRLRPLGDAIEVAAIRTRLAAAESVVAEARTLAAQKNVGTLSDSTVEVRYVNWRALHDAIADYDRAAMNPETPMARPEPGPVLSRPAAREIVEDDRLERGPGGHTTSPPSGDTVLADRQEAGSTPASGTSAVDRAARIHLAAPHGTTSSTWERWQRNVQTEIEQAERAAQARILQELAVDMWMRNLRIGQIDRWISDKIAALRTEPPHGPVG